MKALSIGAAALSIALIAQPAAAATTLSFRASDNGVATGLTGSTTGGVLLIDGSSANFTLAGNAASAPALPSPNFSTNTFNLLTNATAGTKTLVLEVTATGLTSFTGGLMNTFTLNSLTGGSFLSGTISHYLDASNTAYGMGTLVGTSTFSGLNSFNSSSAAAASLTGPFSETAVYTLTFAGGTAGSVSASSQLSAVPEPATWAMMLVGFGFVGATMRRRKQSVRVRFA